MKRGLLASYALLFAGFTLISLSAGSSIVTGNAVFNQISGSIASIVGLAFVGASIGLFLAEGGLEQKMMKPSPENKSIRRKEEKKKGRKISNEEAQKYAARTWAKYQEQAGKGLVENSDGLPKGKSPYQRIDERAEQAMAENENEEFTETYAGPEIYYSSEALRRARKDKYVKPNLKLFQDEIDKLARYISKGHKVSDDPIGDFNIDPKGRSRGPKISWSYDPENDSLMIYDLLYHDEKSNGYVDLMDRKYNDREVVKESYDFKNGARGGRLADLVKSA